MSYVKTEWVNNSTPALSAENLNKIEQGIFDLTEKMTTVYKSKGSVLVANLPTSGMEVGDVYNLLDESSYGPIGTNVVWTSNSTWDALAGLMTIDSTLSSTSTNPLQNKSIYSVIQDILVPIGYMFTWKPISGSTVDLSTADKVHDHYGFGTWQQIKDKFLLSAGDTYTVGATGGEASHILTTNEMPTHAHGSGTLTTETAGAHNHNITGGASIASGSGNAYWWAPIVNGSGTLPDHISTGGQHTHTISGSTANNGSGTAHNNMPPYVTVYVWQRIA